MRAVWKVAHTLAPSVYQLPIGARLVHVDVQFADDEWPTLWFEVDPDARVESRRFEIVGTGYPIPDGWEYRGTGLASDGALVWHVYEVVV